LDALTRATPLDTVREGLRAMQTFQEARAGSLFGDFGGRGWEWIDNFIALGGLYLLYAGIIRWQIPLAVLAGLLVPAGLTYFAEPSRFASPGFHLFSGATMLGAFFIATDPVSASTTDRGRLVYGAGIGLLTFAIRTWGGYPDGVAFAVLLMNAAVPLIDRYTRPRIYGHAER
ncbi:MAG TPA: RnfABCDGE type electron transport complex subunit D, partial [Gammaproteobacteria bacterium]|nr:RnfABCDGE type electron transport complex subunit D [Gammaproteobacteria bacterium]